MGIKDKERMQKLLGGVKPLLLNFDIKSNANFLSFYFSGYIQVNNNLTHL